MENEAKPMRLIRYRGTTEELLNCADWHREWYGRLNKKTHVQEAGRHLAIALALEAEVKGFGTVAGVLKAGRTGVFP